MRKLCLFALPFSAAVCLFVYCLSLRAALIVATFLAAMLVPVLFLRKPLRIRLVWMLAGAVSGLLWCGVYQTVILRPAEAVCGKTAQITVRVSQYPHETEYGVSVLVRLFAGKRSYPTCLYLRESTVDLSPGDLLRGTAAVELANANISSEDGVYLRSTGVDLIARMREGYHIEHTEGIAFRDLPAHLSQFVKTRIQSLFSEETAGFLIALVTGDRSGLGDRAYDAFSVTGVVHILSVSGMHVSMLLGMVLVVAAGRKRLAALIGIPTVIFFVLMVGGVPSVARAGSMQILLLLAPLFRRENDTETAISAALFLLLATNPWSCANVGLQLSFLSTSGIFLFSDRITNWFRRFFARVRPQGIMIYLAGSFSASVSATALTMPLCVYYFGRVSLIAPLANMLILWAVTLLFAFAALLILPVLPGVVEQVLCFLAEHLTHYVNNMTEVLAQIPFAAMYPRDFYTYVGLFFAYAILIAVLFVRVRPFIPVLCATAVMGFCLLYSARQMQRYSLIFSVLDVGQGACGILQCGDFTLMTDCGGDGATGAAIAYLRTSGCNTLDALVLSHYDLDHVNGVQKLLSVFPVAALYAPDVSDSAGTRDTILAYARAQGVPVKLVTENVTLCFEGGTATVFSPVSEGEDNDAGLCVLGTVSGYDILVTGDMTEFAEYRFISRETLPDVELLVAGHHGSRTSTSRALLEVTKPEIVLVSVGENSYGHPNPATLERICASGAEVFRTDECGTITIRR